MPTASTRPFERFRGKRGLVMGLGVFGGGVESTKFLCEYCDSVVVTDLRGEDVLEDSVKQLEGLPIEYRLGAHRKKDFIDADVVIHSPAVRPDNQFLNTARQNGAEVTMEMSLFIEVCPAQTIGITGSNGKTTMALLSYEMLCEEFERAQPELEGKWAGLAEVTGALPAARKVWLGGNCGRPLLNRIDDMRETDVVVLELSSFQLQDWHRVKRSCDISVITNITPNHLDWHRDMDEYVWAKSAIYQYSDGVLIRNAERPELKALEVGPSIGDLAYSTDDNSFAEITREQLLIPGEFNWSNAKGAMACVSLVGALDGSDVVRALARFSGVEHRLEYCGQVNGARCYNDSIATTPESTMAALSAFDAGIHLLLGGSDKGLSYNALGKRIAAHSGIKAIYLQGDNADSIQDAIAGATSAPPRRFDTFDEACDAAVASLEPGDVFLMSPSSASFYEYAPDKRFTNFEHRGQHFKSRVQAQSIRKP